MRLWIIVVLHVKNAMTIRMITGTAQQSAINHMCFEL